MSLIDKYKKWNLHQKVAFWLSVITILVAIVFIPVKQQMKIGDISTIGNNNTYNFYNYSTEERREINEDVKKNNYDILPADFIVKINSISNLKGIQKEYEYLKTLDCGTSGNGKWERYEQKLIEIPGNVNIKYLDALNIRCSETGETKVIYFDITSFFGNYDEEDKRIIDARVKDTIAIYSNKAEYTDEGFIVLSRLDSDNNIILNPRAVECVNSFSLINKLKYFFTSTRMKILNLFY